ncbi:hypothetical protein F5B18DRAFT_70017 [Nemania serpens]|nr:hypothetical protein F5B18DRAFT_70017 [Nemania serpens]
MLNARHVENLYNPGLAISQAPRVVRLAPHAVQRPMFLSWKPCGEGDQAAHTTLSIAFDPAMEKTQSPRACAGCRARKLKCIWVGRGCERCKASV